MTKALIGLLAAVLALAVAGTGDYRHAQEQREHYCHMVAEGYWPDFKETNCGKE